MKNYARLLVLMLYSFIGVNCYSQEKTAYMVADAHLDTQWDWDVQTTINQYIKNTLTDNFALFKKYPNYKFNFEGAIKYMWMKQYYPQQYAELKTYIKNGQWNVCGSSLDAADVNVPSPESQFRNILIGQTFYKKEFGVKSNDIFLPDCFGFGYTLPTIMRHAGLIGFCTQKLSWGGVTIPFRIGAWQGVDGSKVIAAANAGGYGDNFNEDLSYRTELINWTNETSNATNGKHAITYRLYGTGDRGGSPQDNTVNWIEKSIISNGPVKIKSASAGQMYEDYLGSINDFPTHNGELLMTTHGTGCYTSRTMMKRWNRKNELLADATERSAVIADWLGGLSYPTEELNNAWIKFLWHQFHDDLTGTSCERAYTFSYNDEVIAQNKFATVLTNSVGASVRSLNTQTIGTPIVVYNPLSICREDVVEVNINVTEMMEYVKVYNKSGIEVPSQIIESSDGVIKLIFVATVPSLGYEVYDVRPSATSPANDANLQISSHSLENSQYKVSIDSNGDISSIIDKQNASKELLKSPVRLALLTAQGSGFWPSWEVPYETIANEPRAYVDATPQISIEEEGPVRISLKITRTKENSTFVQYIRLTNSDTKRRIDVENDINWKTTGTLLKAVFSLNVSNNKATYDLGLGVIKRSNNTSKSYEIPAQQWADITNVSNSYGVSILNDCKYGWDKPAYNTLRLSLIHSPKCNTGRGYEFQENQDLGNNKFTYSIYGHTNSCLEAGSTWEAAKLNQPLMAFETVKHLGDLGKSFSFLQIDTSQVAVKMLKRAETSDDYVLRLYETKGLDASNIKVKFASRILKAKELNGIEEEIGSASFSDSTLIINMTAFQPKTYSVKLESPVTRSSIPENMPIIIPYNADVVTSQLNMNDGNFDGNSNTYSAELLPDTILSDGIIFAIGSKKTWKKNALKCSGNKITIPNGYKKLYILAASSNMDGSTADFYVDNTPFKLSIPYFSNFVGQASFYKVVGGDTIMTNNYFKKDNIAWVGDHMHNGISKTDQPYQFTYLFKYCIKLPDGAKELILPNDTQIAIFAVTAANNENDDTKPATELVEVQKSEVPLSVPVHCGENLSNGKTATASGMTGSAESPSMALDGNESTKWCQNIVSDKWLMIDLGSSMEICEYLVKHGGIESVNYITKDFKIQRLEGTQWIDVDVITGNTLNTTSRSVTPFTAQKVRLYITNSGSDNAARIYEFQLFGHNTTEINEIISNEKPSIFISPNPVTTESFEVQLSGFNDDTEVLVTIADSNGREVYRSKRNNSSSLTLTLKNRISNGVFYVTVRGKQKVATKQLLGQ